jgi:hypothetical protein
VLERTVQKKNSDPRNQRSGSLDTDKPERTQLVLDMKAEMGSMRKAMIRSGISYARTPNEQKQKEPSANGKQKNNFAAWWHVTICQHATIYLR